MTSCIPATPGQQACRNRAKVVLSTWVKKRHDSADLGQVHRNRGRSSTTCLGSTASGVVALCSESMAEGYNLQRASAVVHLDMPSVVRTAEQRVGRVDRLDSPHVAIDA